MTDLEPIWQRTQDRLERLRRHRHEVGFESAQERATRQWHRAEAVALSLGSTKRGVVRSMLALVVADEHPDPPGDPVPPKAPGARAVIKPRKAKAAPKATPVPVETEEPGLW